jgi:membrane protease YdiL (CAAX protease family)
LLRAKALETVRSRAAIGVIAITAYLLAVEWIRVLLIHGEVAGVAGGWGRAGGAVTGLILGGMALVVAAAGWPLSSLGLGTSRLALRVIGGLALGAVLLLPAAVRSSAAPMLPASLALAAIAISIGEEVAFRGALYAALERWGGAPVAIVGSTAVWTAAHAFSHPPEFLGAVAAAGLLLALWRWACRDLVGPILAHVIADLAL